ncbi:hypothetical protein [Actinomadura parmotrematis]|uniref:Uncharacterized protein n=1 Tax=Actinomadura parmotrematis TaxID=2864039 RepID=A0ABS7FRG9_9ACTN|nr:hypothetical protein [Actinomadura parmotrematis]MBW8482142.1 hypothetical protein [Actinomadura parmotrematis]
MTRDGEDSTTRVDHPFDSYFARKYYRAGQVSGALSVLLNVLEARDVRLSAEQRKRVVECDDLEQLRDWLVRAANAVRADEIFA